VRRVGPERRLVKKYENFQNLYSARIANLLPYVVTMLLFALTTMEKLERVPVEFWLKMFSIVAIFALSIVLMRSISQMNRVVLTISVTLIVTVLGFNWVYERNEPKVLTPAINFIAPFFPSKGTTTNW
jgi:heme/copper-type cytochrome/quinol oxidase subunit 2